MEASLPFFPAQAVRVAPREGVPIHRRTLPITHQFGLTSRVTQEWPRLGRSWATVVQILAAVQGRSSVQIPVFSLLFSSMGLVPDLAGLHAHVCVCTCTSAVQSVWGLLCTHPFSIKGSCRHTQWMSWQEVPSASITGQSAPHTFALLPSPTASQTTQLPPSPHLIHLYFPAHGGVGGALVPSAAYER